MAIQSSPEVVRQMKSSLQKTVRSIQDTQNRVKSAMNSSSAWTDAQGQQYQSLMKRIAQLTESPVATLNAALPKLEKLAQSLDRYNQVHF